jgi:pyruvate formate lyase activating enzyme
MSCPYGNIKPDRVSRTKILKCDFCQNHNISQSEFKRVGSNQILTPEKFVKKAKEISDNIGIAFTYNEPVIWFEYMKECAELAKSEGLSTVMISAGYVNEEPLEEIIGFINAFNIDLKSFSDKTYRETSGAGIEPVKKSLKMISDAGKHLEITSLIIPDLNDSADEMLQEAEWIANELGKHIPLHISRYFPMFKRDNPPTPKDVMMRLYEIASSRLDFVYLDNFR